MDLQKTCELRRASPEKMGNLQIEKGPFLWYNGGDVQDN
jgi:hypothetical protein